MKSINEKFVSPNGAEQKITGRYFKVPNMVFDLKLSTYALVVLLNLLRRADKYGECFPGIPRICSDTGIGASNTVRKAIKELIAANLISSLQRRKGSSTIYQLSLIFYEKIRLADEKNQTKKTITPSPHEGVTPSGDEFSPLQEMSTKEYKKNNTNFFKENDRAKDSTNGVLQSRINDTKKNEFPIRDSKQKMNNGTSLISKLNLKGKFEFQVKQKINYELTPSLIKKAELDLEHIRTKNHREHPEIYKT